MNANLGNTCAGSLMWAWSTVCDSLTGSFINTNMVYKYGCLPVGNYTLPNMETINSCYDYGTDQVCTYNGSDVIYACYAQMKPADAVTSSTKAHAMMIMSDPVVVYNEDGTIDAASSYVYIQDQAAGTSSTESKFFEVTGEDGTVYHYTGRTEKMFTFEQLFTMNYIPMTTAEFQGEAYTKAQVAFTQAEADTVARLLTGTVISNYPMSILKVDATSENGETVTVHRYYFNRADVKSGKARRCSLAADAEAIEAALADLPFGTYTVTLEITAPNGEVFTPATVTYTK